MNNVVNSIILNIEGCMIRNFSFQIFIVTFSFEQDL